LDTSVVNVALPRIQEDLDASSSALQWTISGYALPFAIGMITGGRLGDLYGRKRVFSTGLALFVVTSLLCTLAQSGGQLVAFRVAQGIAAALMVPQVIATIQVMYAPHERARPLTVAAAMYAVSSSLIAPIFGGLALNVLAPRFGRRVVQVGLVVFILALVTMLLVMRAYGPDANAVMLALPLVLGGVGGGLSLVLVVDFAISDVPVDEAGSAAGVLNAVQQIGAAIGVSAVGALFFGLLPAEQTSDWASDASRAFELTMILPVCLMTVAFVASFLLPHNVTLREAPSTTVDEPVTAG
jgi:MFS family permease